MLLIILFTAIGIYLIELIILRIGIWKSDHLSQQLGYEPYVTIMVAARDEEEFIGDCITSLLKIDYPENKFEIIIVNDSSTDKTPEIVQSFAHTGRNLRMVTTTTGTGNLRGKANAIAQGMETAIGEIVLFTDADCRVPKNWVKETVKYFGDDTGIVGGFTLLNANRSFEGIQALDWLFLFGLASATSGLKIPLTAIGNNLAIRMQAYKEVGGYKDIPFSVTEDYALVQSILQRTEYKIKFPLEPNCLVQSSACKSWEQLYRQKKRWGVGGTDMILRGYLIMFVGWMAKFLILISLFFLDPKITAVAFVITSIGEMIFLEKILGRFRVRKYFKFVFPFLLYFLIYVLVIPFIAFFSRNVVWKKRSLT
ncbi:MAG: glycosyltransferase [Ignavibacteriales bacterium]|nr:glycosyltransferase [Ignavibacteriales bacterium]